MKKRRNMRHGYAGKQYDTVTGMYDYGFRDYSPASARFTTPDPIRDGRNWFSYVNNDPVNYVDLWGLMASEPKQGNGSQIMPQGIQLTVTVMRKNQGYGDLFDATRIIGVDNGIYGSLKYFDMIGANAASVAFAKEHKGMTLPDGIYYLTSAGLEKQADGTFNSNSYKNVLRLQTNDENIPKEIRDLINNDYYLLHANQFKNSETQYNGGTLPRSAGCNITQSQEAHDKMMDVLNLAKRPEDIKYIITSEE